MLRGRIGRRLGAMAIGVLTAAGPAVAAAEQGARELDTPADTHTALLLLGSALFVAFVVTSIGFLYRRQRGLRWDYQLPQGALSEGQGRTDDEGSH